VFENWCKTISEKERRTGEGLRGERGYNQHVGTKSEKEAIEGRRGWAQLSIKSTKSSIPSSISDLGAYHRRPGGRWTGKGRRFPAVYGRLPPLPQLQEYTYHLYRPQESALKSRPSNKRRLEKDLEKQ